MITDDHVVVGPVRPCESIPGDSHGRTAGRIDDSSERTPETFLARFVGAERAHVVALATWSAIVIGWRIGSPDRLFFDEVHYVPNAIAIWEQGSEVQRLAHPPWGKILIGAGVELFGDNPYGWRIVPALSGVVIVMATFVAMKVLSGRHLLALATGLLVSLDGLVISMSRIAMLDIIAAAHVMAAFALLVLDRQRRDDAIARPLAGPVRFTRLAACVLLGGSVATKWSSVPALVVLGLAVLFWDHRRSKRIDEHRPASANARWALTFVALPFAVYVATHSAWIVNYPSTQTAQERCVAENCESGLAEVSAGWVEEQTSKVELQQKLIISHPYRSAAIGWPVASRPVLYYAERCAEASPECEVAVGREARILALGNVAVWWASIPALGVVAVQILRRRLHGVGIVPVMGLALWAPWIVSINPGFMFYMTPVVPFMAMTVGLAIHSARSACIRRWATATIVSAACVVFVFFYPIWTGLEVDIGGVDQRILFEQWR